MDQSLEPDQFDPLFMLPLDLLLGTFLKQSLVVPHVPSLQRTLHPSQSLGLHEHLQLVITHLLPHLYLLLIPLRSILLSPLFPALKRPFS